jgi:hypothetical protein
MQLHGSSPLCLHLQANTQEYAPNGTLLNQIAAPPAMHDSCSTLVDAKHAVLSL